MSNQPVKRYTADETGVVACGNVYIAEGEDVVLASDYATPETRCAELEAENLKLHREASILIMDMEAMAEGDNWPSRDQRIAELEADLQTVKNTVENVEIEAKGRIALARQTVTAQEHKLAEQAAIIEQQLARHINDTDKLNERDERINVLRRYRKERGSKFVEQAETIARLRDNLTGQYDAYMDALKAEHDTLLRTGHVKTATGTTRAMMILGEIHAAALEASRE